MFLKINFLAIEHCWYLLVSEKYNEFLLQKNYSSYSQHNFFRWFVSDIRLEFSLTSNQIVYDSILSQVTILFKNGDFQNFSNFFTLSVQMSEKSLEITLLSIHLCSIRISIYLEVQDFKILFFPDTNFWNRTIESSPKL